MDPLPPIPTPPAQRWREFRIQVLPIITFLVIVVCVVFMWQRYVLPSNVVGEVEAVRATVNSLVDGTIKELRVERFQMVSNGQEIAIIETSDPETFQAARAVIASDLALLKVRLQLDQQRIAQNYEDFRLDLMAQESELEVNKVRLIRAEAEHKRSEELFSATNSTERLISPTEYDRTKTARDVLKKTVEEQERFVEEKRRTLPKITSAYSGPDPFGSLTAEAIAAKEKELELTQQRVVLKAPMDGMIASINHRAGEKILAGTVIATISATRADRITAYLLPPLTVRPNVGDRVQVRRQAFQRTVMDAVVIDVGNQIEQVSSNLVDTANTKIILGLPFSVSLPPELNLTPGELVDLVLPKVDRK